MNLIDHRINSRCPHCAVLATGALGASLTDHDGPAVGDVNVCFYCHEVSVFDFEMELRRPTESERIAYLLCDDVRRAIQAVTAMPKWPHPDQVDGN